MYRANGVVTAGDFAPGVPLTQTCAPCMKKDKILAFYFGVIYARDSEFNIGLIMTRHSTDYLTD